MSKITVEVNKKTLQEVYNQVAMLMIWVFLTFKKANLSII